MKKTIIAVFVMLCLAVCFAACNQGNAKWEYIFLERGMDGDYKKLQDRANTLGKEGWELVCMDPGRSIFFFKRKL